MILDGNLWTANVGDSRIVIDNNGTPIQMTEDATLSNPKYAQQVIARGGQVVNKIAEITREGVAIFIPRVNGKIAVARAIGDHELGGAISPRPKITKIPLSELHPNHHIILCCDGVFEVASTRQVVGVAHREGAHRYANELAADIVHSAIESGSRDNVSCVVVRHITEEAAAAAEAASISPAPPPPARFYPLPPSAPNASQEVGGTSDASSGTALGASPPARPEVADPIHQPNVAAAAAAAAAWSFPQLGRDPFPPRPTMPMVFPPAPMPPAQPSGAAPALGSGQPPVGVVRKVIGAIGRFLGI